MGTKTTINNPLPFQGSKKHKESSLVKGPSCRQKKQVGKKAGFEIELLLSDRPDKGYATPGKKAKNLLPGNPVNSQNKGSLTSRGRRKIK